MLRIGTLIADVKEDTLKRLLIKHLITKRNLEQRKSNIKIWKEKLKEKYGKKEK